MRKMEEKNVKMEEKNMKNEGTKWAIGGTKCANEGTKSKMKEQKNSPRTFYCLLRFSSIHNLNTILFSSNSEQLQTLNQETCDIIYYVMYSICCVQYRYVHIHIGIFLTFLLNKLSLMNSQRYIHSLPILYYTYNS